MNFKLPIGKLWIIICSATLWNSRFAQGSIVEECEDDTIQDQYCPLRPMSSSALNQDLTAAFDVCEHEILPICVTAPRPKPLTVPTLKPVTPPITRATTTTTASTTASTTAITSITSTSTSATTRTTTESSINEECEEHRSRCDMSMTWLSSKTTIDISLLTVSSPERIAVEPPEATSQRPELLHHPSPAAIVQPRTTTPMPPETSTHAQPSSRTEAPEIPMLPHETPGEPSRAYFKEIQDVFKNFPIFNPHFTHPHKPLPVERDDKYSRRDNWIRQESPPEHLGIPLGQHQPLISGRIPPGANLWKTRKTLADVWKADERFPAQAEKYRGNLKHTPRQRQPIEIERNKHLRLEGFGRKGHNNAIKVEWDYFHPM